MPRIRFPRIGKFLESGESRKMGKNQVNLGKWEKIRGFSIPASLQQMSQFCRVILKKLLRLKSITFNAVVYQLVGMPEVEWHRRWLQTAFSKEQCVKKYEWAMLQSQRQSRAKLRRLISWHTSFWPPFLKEKK